MGAELQPVPGVAALRLDPRLRSERRWLVVADLHLGLGGTPERPAGPPGGSAPAMAEELLRTARAEKARGILVAGDAKHPIVGTPRYLRPVVFEFFAELLSAGLEVEVVPGNHDGGLVPHLPREVVVRSPAGIVRWGVGVVHGHCWPAASVLRAPQLVTGHLHPGFRLAPTSEHPGGKRRCWIRARRPPSAPSKPPSSRRFRATEVVVLPAFNPIAGTEALNRERPGRGRSFLFRRLLAGSEARAYLLDGTDLGQIPTPPALPIPGGASPRARRAR